MFLLVPGAGTYRTQMCVVPKKMGSDQAQLDRTRITHEPVWRFGTGKQIAFDSMPGVVVESPGPAAYDKFVEIL